MIGRELSRYRILEKLGSGGMGEVYLALDTTLDRKVALKVLPAELASDAGRTRRLESEARAASALNHPNVAHIYEIGSADDINFIAMEYVAGVSLARRIQERRLSVAEVVRISLQVLDVLELAHSQGVIHSDLKPANIMLTTSGQVKIVDFGLAKVMKPAPLPAEDLTWTNAGTIRGTVLYMSPEQALGRQVDHRTDIFSFGIVLFEMLTSRRPFEGGNAHEVVDNLLHHDPKPISHFRHDTSPEMERIVRKCLEKKIGARYGAAREIAADLQGMSEAAGAPQSGVSRWLGDRTGFVAAALLFLIGLGVLGGFVAYRSALGPAAGLVESLAVMPLENASSEQEMEYLSDGITEHLINNLSQLPHLRVLARGSVFRYKGQHINPIDVGKELKVRAVLTGRVLQRGDTLTVQAELVDTRNGMQLWGHQFNRKVAEIFEVQEEISRQISENLKLKLTGEEAQRITIRHTDNVPAYHAYLKGLLYLNKRTAADIGKAIGYFNESKEKDLRYALAYAGLAYCYALLGSVEYGVLPPRESIPKAKDAAKHALELDEHLADAHVLMAFVHVYYDWNWTEAEAEFLRAIQLNPWHTTARHWYAEFLAARGDFDKAFKQIQLAQETASLSLIINTADGRIHYLARQHDAAAERLVKTLEMDGNFVMAQVALGLVYGQLGKHDQAQAWFEKATALTGGAVVARMGMGHSYALAGKTDQALQVVKDLTSKTEGVYVSPAYLAAIYAGLGKRDEAFALLDRAVEERSGALVFLRVEPIVDKLRSDPRFELLLKRVGL